MRLLPVEEAEELRTVVLLDEEAVRLLRTSLRLITFLPPLEADLVFALRLRPADEVLLGVEVFFEVPEAVLPVEVLVFAPLFALLFDFLFLLFVFLSATYIKSSKSHKVSPERISFYKEERRDFHKTYKIYTARINYCF